MGCLLYTLYTYLHSPNNFPYDTAIFCLLLSLDTQSILRFWLWKKGS